MSIVQARLAGLVPSAEPLPITPQFTPELEMRVSSLPSANNSFHLYLADPSGRKVAALWGGNDEKMANGYLWSAAAALYETLDECRDTLALLNSRFESDFGKRSVEVDKSIANADAALARARGEQPDAPKVSE